MINAIKLKQKIDNEQQELNEDKLQLHDREVLLEESEDAFENAKDESGLFFCEICTTGIKKKYFEPCGHGVCISCYDNIDCIKYGKCHVCRENIQKTITLFIE